MTELSKKELLEIKFAFNAIDADKDGHIESKELGAALKKIGEDVSPAKLKELIALVDKNNNGKIEFDEFIELVKKIKSGSVSEKSELGQVLKKTGQVLNKISSQGDTYTAEHSYSQEEVEAFSEHINMILKDDPDVKDMLPLTGEQLFEAVGDGVLLCKLINASFPDTIDVRVINTKKNKNAWEKNENLQLAIQSAKGIGCRVVNITPETLGKGLPHIVLGLVWQIIKLGLMADISLQETPALVCLLKEGEDIKSLMKLTPEKLLIRWVNYHMEKAGSDRRISNFASDIQDSVVYTILLNRICPNKECDLSPLNESDLVQRAEKMLQQADKINCRKFVLPKNIAVLPNPKLNLAFVANLFNQYPCLEEVNTDDYADLLDFDSEGSREERAFKFWLQSLGFDVNSLSEDLSDGVVLLELENKVFPGSVDMSKVNYNPSNKFKMVENVNLVVSTAQKCKLSTVNIGGLDILEGKKKMILAIVWQLMRANLLNILKEIGGGKAVEEKDLVQWANERVGDMKIDSFKDPSLKTGVFLCKLCYAISPRSCNMDFVTPGETSEDAEQNAKYAISVARKIGATVFLLWEDIVEVKPKMILTFVGALMQVWLKMQGSK